MKRKNVLLKRAILLFWTLLVVLSVAACKGGTENPDTTPTGTVEPIVDAASLLTLAENGICNYTVVRGDTSSKTVTTASVSLVKALKAVTESEPTIVTDYEAETECEILVGETNREASARAAEELGENDFIVKVLGKKLVILGKNDSATAAGVRHVIRSLLGYRSAIDYDAYPTLTLADNYCYAEVMSMTVKDPRNEEDVIIYTNNVLDFGAIADGTTDCTKAFQSAIDAARAVGGGTVYVPAGQYLIKGSLKVTRSVYLVGEWQNPETNPESVRNGTVLLATGNAGKADKEPLLTIGASAGVLGLTIYYPNQTVANPVAYPPAILLKDSLAGDGTQHASSVQCVTIVNAWQGVAADKGLQLPTVRDVYVTALDYGLRVNGCYDCARFITMHVSPAYWASYDAKTDKATVADYMQANTIGFILMRTDSQMMTDVVAESCNIGISLERNTEDTGETAGGTSISDLVIKNCTIGINNEYNSLSVSGATVSCVGADAVCLINRSTTGAGGTMSFYGTTFTSEGDNCIFTEEGAGCLVSVQSCTFAAWNGEYAVVTDGGMLILTNNAFEGKTGGVSVKNGTQAASVTGNLFAAEMTRTVVNALSDDAALIETSSVGELDSAMNAIVDIPAVPALGKTAVFRVTDYGAKGDGKTDDTQAFEKAIEAADTAGGGIVYVPAGYYNIKGNLTLPTGVELRGIHESLHVISGEGSVLYVTAGVNEEDAAPFLTMEQGSALRGITFWYPEQAWNNVKSYPFTVQVTGQNCILRNLCFGNSYEALDMETYDCGGHYVENISGSIFRTGIAIDGSTKAGTLLSTHFNPSFYYACWGTKLSDDSGDFCGSGMATEMFRYVNANLTAYRFGKTTEETLLFVFNYRAKYGMDFTGGFEGTVIGCGVDGSICGIRVTGDYTVPLTLLNVSNDVVPGSTPEGNLGVYVNVSDDSTVRMIESGASSYNYVPSELVVLENGELILDGFDARVSPTENGAIWIKGGVCTARGVVFKHVGRLDDAGNFTDQTKGSAIDVQVDSGATLALQSALARNFYKSKVQGTLEPDNSLVTH